MKGALRTFQGCILIAVTFALLAIWAWPARGHEAGMGWQYDPYCCNGNSHNGDCQEIPASTVRPIEGGYIITLVPGDHRMVTKPHTFTVKASEAKYSPDGLFHICLYPTENEVRCFYVPPMGT